MTSFDRPIFILPDTPFSSPWPPLLAGIGLTALAYLVFVVFHVAITPLLLVGLIAAGIGITVRPQSPQVLAAAAMSGAASWATIRTVWDSAGLLVAVLTCVALFAALMMLLPRLLRRVIFSLLILFHFVGIFSAALNIAPYPFLANQLWLRVYRPYLQFLYLNNAYHFYSPEPGPGALIWFWVEYDDGTGDWFKLPERKSHRLAIQYQRRLSFSESVNQQAGATPTDDMVRARMQQGERDHIPPDPSRPLQVQFGWPSNFSERMLQTYARYVCRNPPDRTKTVVGVKIYRVVHAIPDPKYISEGTDPAAKYWYLPYFQGEFSPEGVLENPRDPYLYWLIPMYLRVFEEAGLNDVEKEKQWSNPKAEVVDCLQRHIALRTMEHAFQGPKDPGQQP